MKKLQLASLIVLSLEVLLWAAGQIRFPLPDWAVRANGVAMLVTLALLAFSSVRARNL